MNDVSSHISHVFQEEQHQRVLIFFQYKSEPLFLELDEVLFNGTRGFRLRNVYHNNRHHERLIESCPFCQKPNNRGYCSVLTESKNALFNELKEHNKIRLYWLYQTIFSL